MAGVSYPKLSAGQTSACLCLSAHSIKSKSSILDNSLCWVSLSPPTSLLHGMHGMAHPPLAPFFLPSRLSQLLYLPYPPPPCHACPSCLVAPTFYTTTAFSLPPSLSYQLPFLGTEHVPIFTMTHLHFAPLEILKPRLLPFPLPTPYLLPPPFYHPPHLPTFACHCLSHTLVFFLLCASHTLLPIPLPFLFLHACLLPDVRGPLETCLRCWFRPAPSCC